MARCFALAARSFLSARTKDALRDPWIRKHRKQLTEIDCAGKVVLPGFVDSHTHPVFVSPRLVDFEKRIEGASYEQIAAAGGGIRSSLEAVRNAAKSALKRKVLEVLHDMAAYGTTTVEAKSGYGLTLESELKSLEAIREAASGWAGTVVPTLLGAHVVPKEFQGCSQKYVEIVCKEMIPQAARRNLAQFVDVFCDKGAFTPEETEQIFAAAREHGLSVRAHVGQLSETALGPVTPVRSGVARSHGPCERQRCQAAGETEYACHAGPGRELFPWTKDLSRCEALHRCRRSGRIGNGLQSGNFAHCQHADGDVACVHTDEDVAGRSDRGRDHQWSLGAPYGGSKGQHRTGKRR